MITQIQELIEDLKDTKELYENEAKEMEEQKKECSYWVGKSSGIGFAIGELQHLLDSNI